MWSFFNRDPSKDFGYEIGNPISSFSSENVWTLLNGKKKGTGEPVSIFKLEIDPNTNRQLVELAKAAVKRLKTLRHPSFLTFLDSFESDKLLCMVTEHVLPLKSYLETIENSTLEKKHFTISYGIHQIANGLSFFNIDANLQHNNIRQDSIFVNKAGIWKIGGLEYISQTQDNYWPPKVFSTLDKYDPPEKKDANSYKKHAKWSRDAYGLGCLIYECFNGTLSSNSALSNHQRIPDNLIEEYDSLIVPNPNKRANFSTFLSECKSNGRFLKNCFVDSMIFLDEIHLKDQIEKNRFFNNLHRHIDKFPSGVCINKILPQLIEAIELNNGGAVILNSLFKIGKMLDNSEYQRLIVPCIVKLFGCKDRVTRAKLLEEMEHFVDHLQANIVNEQIYVHVCQGFVDSSPVIREQTVKSMSYLAPKLSSSNLNDDMLKHFSRLVVSDEEVSIRINTTVCLGKIACYLQPSTRQTILIPSFLRSMRDPSPQARLAAIQGLAATQNFFSLKDTATKAMPALCHMTMDCSKDVRDQAFKILKEFVSKIERVSENPDLAKELESQLNAAVVSSSNSSASSWASWAVSSFTSKLAKMSNKQSPQSKLSTSDSAVAPTGISVANDSTVQKSITSDYSSFKKSFTKEAHDEEEYDDDSLSSGSKQDARSAKKASFSSGLSVKMDAEPLSSIRGWEYDENSDYDSFEIKNLEEDEKDRDNKRKTSTSELDKKDNLSIASKPFAKLSIHNDNDNDDDENELENMYSSRKQNKPRKQDDTLWDSLGSKSNNESSTSRKKEKATSEELDDLFASLSGPTVKKPVKLGADKKKRGPMKLGAQKKTAN